ncbi:hypothetical protein NA78x_002920 [Anatilimnocola sp. NA78]|uniref:hypothetical protein n=1 Tax=Anatilimnocola sp. NA78 TaxID=3415683 RepID=UPI003CE4D8BE
MDDYQRTGGNGAAVAIIVVFGIVVFLGGVFVLGAGALFFVRSSAPMSLPTATANAVSTPPVATKPGPVGENLDLSDASSTPKLPLELNSQDEILLNGEVKSLEELKTVLKAMKNGNTQQTEIKIKFSGSSPAKTAEMMALLKEACVFFEVDPTGDVPADAAMP